MGRAASKFCSNYLNDEIARLKNSILSSVTDEMNHDRNSYEDFVLCEAIRRCFDGFNKKIKSNVNAGTTALSLFMNYDSNGSCRITCAWVGDSRCVMYKCKKDPETGSNQPVYVYMSEDHKPMLKREIDRIEARIHEDKVWYKLPLEVDESSFRQEDRNDWEPHEKVVYTSLDYYY